MKAAPALRLEPGLKKNYRREIARGKRGSEKGGLQEMSGRVKGQGPWKGRSRALVDRGRLFSRKGPQGTKLSGRPEESYRQSQEGGGTKKRKQRRRKNLYWMRREKRGWRLGGRKCSRSLGILARNRSPGKGKPSERIAER